MLRNFFVSARKTLQRPVLGKRYIADLISNEDTIFALSSAPGRAAVSMIRISGPRAEQVMKSMCGEVQPRQAALRKILHPRTSEVLDKSLVLFFPGPKSFTGEDVVEFHVHGGRAVVSDVLDAVGTCAGTRPAEPGEFSKRAFFNGKLDLTEIEGLADLINADTQAQRRQALRQMEGDFGRLVEGWREDMLQSLAYMTAFIDFGEDDEIPTDVFEKVAPRVQALRRNIQKHLDDGRRGERLRDGLHVAIVGPPNAGKSSLLNLLAQRDAAIVSEVAGTTRDVVEVSLNLGGYPVVLADTAGIRETSDPIELEGIARAAKRMKSADIILVVIDSSTPESLTSTANEILTQAGDSVGRPGGPFIVFVLNKADRGGSPTAVESSFTVPDSKCLSISCKTKEGVESLIDVVGSIAKERLEMTSTEAAPITRARHRHHLQEALNSMDLFLEHQAQIDVASEHLRQAAWWLGGITGKIDVEEVLGVVFAEFCIGK